MGAGIPRELAPPAGGRVWHGDDVSDATVALMVVSIKVTEMDQPEVWGPRVRCRSESVV